MFFKVCRGSTVDEDAHHHAAHVQEKKTKNLPSFSNPFHNYTKSKQRSKLVDASPISDDDAAAEASPVIIGSRGRGGEDNRKTTSSKTSSINLIGRASSKKDFVKRTALGTGTQHSFHDPHSLPSLDLAFQSFKQVYPRFEETVAVDFLRDREYHGQCLLAAEEENGHVVLDYCGFGLFSQWQQVCVCPSSVTVFSLCFMLRIIPFMPNCDSISEISGEFFCLYSLRADCVTLEHKCLENLTVLMYVLFKLLIVFIQIVILRYKCLENFNSFYIFAHYALYTDYSPRTQMPGELY